MIERREGRALSPLILIIKLIARDPQRSIFNVGDFHVGICNVSEICS